MAKISFHEFIASLLPSEEVQDFFATCTKYLPKTIYPLYHKNPVSDIEFVATKNKRNLTPFTNISPSRMYTLQGESAHHEVGSHLIHELGLCYVQEGAASVPAQLLNPQEGELILDMCAAPGGKTVQLADALLQTENPGLVIANEPDPLRRNALIANCKRTGLRNTVITWYDATLLGNLLPDFFDKVLVDVPCSGEWMFYKTKQVPDVRPEVSVKKLVPLQYKLLESAYKACKPGGLIVYSTCTLNPYENEMNVARFLEAYAGKVELEETGIAGVSPWIVSRKQEKILPESQAKKLIRCRPHREQTGGFFVAKFKKIVDGVRVQNFVPPLQKTSLHPIKNNSKNEFWITYPDMSICVEEATTILLASAEIMKLPKYIKIEKSGVSLFKKGEKSGNLTPLPYYAMLLWAWATKNYIELSDTEAEKYLTTQQCVLSEEKEIPEGNADGFLILRRRGRGIACIKSKKIINYKL